jgi:hypothetical protein
MKKKRPKGSDRRRPQDAKADAPRGGSGRPQVRPVGRRRLSRDNHDRWSVRAPFVSTIPELLEGHMPLPAGTFVLALVAHDHRKGHSDREGGSEQANGAKSCRATDLQTGGDLVSDRLKRARVSSRIGYGLVGSRAQRRSPSYGTCCPL